MIRRSLMLVALVAALLAGSRTTLAESTQIAAAPPATLVQAPVLPAPSRDALNIRVEHILAIAAGAVAADLLLDGLLHLPGGASLVVGGILGYYVYVNFIEPETGSIGRRISGAADEAKLYLINAGGTTSRASAHP